MHVVATKKSPHLEEGSQPYPATALPVHGIPEMRTLFPVVYATGLVVREQAAVPAASRNRARVAVTAKKAINFFLASMHSADSVHQNEPPKKPTHSRINALGLHTVAGRVRLSR